MSNIIYFDNAATTFPKPESVIMTVVDCMKDYCGNPGRGSHYLALKSAEKVYESREAVASMFNALPENVIFTFNTTYALNMAIKGVMKNGGHILISNMEHNSSLRPITHLALDNTIRYDIFKAYDSQKPLTPQNIIDNIIKKLRPTTKMLTCIHSSNICSYTLPIREIGHFCRHHGIIFCVDAAQSAGHVPIDLREDCIDILCMPAHKGLYSPQGCGIMVIGDKCPSLNTLIEGGNGVNSLETTMGNDSPEKYEGGTLCTPAIAGLCSGIDFIKNIGINNVSEHEKELWYMAYDRLSSIRGLRIYDSTPGSVLLFNIEEVSCDRLGRALSDEGFCLRSGYHCSPLAHKALNTPIGGAVRIGFGIFNTKKEVDALYASVLNFVRQA